jgi:hypothetical protein
VELYLFVQYTRLESKGLTSTLRPNTDSNQCTVRTKLAEECRQEGEEKEKDEDGTGASRSVSKVLG